MAIIRTVFRVLVVLVLLLAVAAGVAFSITRASLGPDSSMRGMLTSGLLAGPSL